MLMKCYKSGVVDYVNLQKTEFHDTDESIMDKFIISFHDHDLSLEIQMRVDDDPTLDEVMRFARQYELIKKTKSTSGPG